MKSFFNTHGTRAAIVDTEVMSYVVFVGFWVINKYQLFAELNAISICNSQ